MSVLTITLFFSAFAAALMAALATLMDAQLIAVISVILSGTLGILVSSKLNL